MHLTRGKIRRLDFASKKSIDQSHRIRSLRQKLKLVQTKIWKKDKIITRLQSQLSALKQQLKENNETCMCKNLSESQRGFVTAQGKANVLPKKGMRWTYEEKCRAISLYLKSPAAYRQQASFWRLPHKTTIGRLVSPLFQRVSSVHLQ